MMISLLWAKVSSSLPSWMVPKVMRLENVVAW